MPETEHTNALINETSPYLLQHAHNPVDWHPWGDGAIKKARAENKPIFLSIGYSTCHWCHVMERESFENPEIASLMNEHFVCIKVDREERPDLDEVYMQAAQLLTGQGGWPLSVFLDTQLRPFYAGTYFPPVDMHGRPGFPKLLTALSQAHRERPDDIAASASDLVNAISQNSASLAQSGSVDFNILERAASVILASFDAQNGGFGPAPKFPASMTMQFLLREYYRRKDNACLDAVCATLDHMIRGGIFDHIGGGFHRYSTDDVWLVPHFEKMLYDNALLLSTLVEAWQITRRDDLPDAANRTIEFVFRELTTPDGCFASALDADTEGEEGLFYVWTPDEVTGVLGQSDSEIFCRVYGVTREGNFEGKSIPYLRATLDQLAKLHDQDPETLPSILAEMREKLQIARNQRTRPGLDDKVVVSWNGLMISAMAKAGRAFGRSDCTRAASLAADFIMTNVQVGGSLAHTYRSGQAKGLAFQEDYACLALGLVDLYEATGERSRLDQAERLIREMLELFWDDESQGFFYSRPDHATPIVRSKNPLDGVTPSGNSAAALAMARLAALLDLPELRTRAEQTVDSLAGLLGKAPRAFENLLNAAFFTLSPPREIVTASDSSHDAEMVAIVNSAFLPDAVTSWHTPDTEETALTRGKSAIGGRTAVYVCSNYACQSPITDADELKRTLG